MKSSFKKTIDMRGIFGQNPNKINEEERYFAEHRSEESLFRSRLSVRGRTADACRKRYLFALFPGPVGDPFGGGTSFLSMGKVFLAGLSLKEDELPDEGE